MQLEKFYEVKKWIMQVKESSRAVYLSAMKAYCEFTGLNPKELIDEAEEDRKKPVRQQGTPEMRLSEFFEWLTKDYEMKTRGTVRKPSGKKGISKMMALTYVGAIRSFYRRNGFPITAKLPKAAPKPENIKRSLSTEDVRKLISHAPTLRDRAIVLFMFQAGFDVSTLCSLNYGNVRKELEEGKTPLMIHAVRSKDETPYFTFVGRDAVEALKAYLNDRRAKGEVLTDKTPLFIKEGAKRGKHERISSYNVQNMLRETALKAGLVSEEELKTADLNPCRPHALRSAFSTTLKLKGFDPNLVDFMMGHRLPYGGAYLIPPEEKVRQMYAEVERYLSISGNGYVEKELQEKLRLYRSEVNELQNQINDLRRLIEILMTSVLDTGEKKLETSELINRLQNLINQRTIRISEIKKV